MRTLKKLIATFFVLGALLLLASPAMASESVSVEVRTIMASTDGEDCDRRLRRLCSRLERGFGGYSSFRQLGNDTLNLDEGESGSIRLPNASTLTLEYFGTTGEFVKLGLTIGERLNTTLRATPGSTFFQAGLNHDGGILILAITVR